MSPSPHYLATHGGVGQVYYCPPTMSTKRLREFNSAGTTYTLAEDLSYHNFFSAFDFFSGPDPTEGFVQYQNYTSAIEQGLVGYLSDTQSVFLGVDHTSKNPNGRASVRLESKKGWNKGLLVADIRHMPASTCGSWPAYWLLGSHVEINGKITWPDAGEIDILEGVNDYESNAVTLHTSTGCMIDNTTSPATGSDSTPPPFTGFLKTDDCDVAAPDQRKNVGCSIAAPSAMTPSRPPSFKRGTASIDADIAFPSYGTSFNLATGGVYAMEWTSASISVWFIPRVSPQFNTLFPAPASSTFLNTTLDVSALGTPIAHFAGQCDFEEKFKNLKIVFDTTFCGAWAGAEWESGGCAKKTGVATCEEYVRENPGVFAESYWEVAGLKWFQKDEVQVNGYLPYVIPKVVRIWPPGPSGEES
ncbi:glycoside hydrolase family 16 protein [Macroventuria anomochaeta]|uniref:Glycoside hydrolase family 16 protein n=1 Tax=Macroventuria anomochaeta TaxID=301207 RepID=A0ACB6S873_9PLEO|nr:glycoside hydrolase family 16 protein [Macroventuria anomochaeta]KAF2630163.1 glycoside hydrolase family 16 protein [Macroventuria anomochaeta]